MLPNGLDISVWLAQYQPFSLRRTSHSGEEKRDFKEFTIWLNLKGISGKKKKKALYKQTGGFVPARVKGSAKSRGNHKMYSIKKGCHHFSYYKISGKLMHTTSSSVMSVYSGCMHSTYLSGNRGISNCRSVGTKTLYLCSRPENISKMAVLLMSSWMHPIRSIYVHSYILIY